MIISCICRGLCLGAGWGLATYLGISLTGSALTGTLGGDMSTKLVNVEMSVDPFLFLSASVYIDLPLFKVRSSVIWIPASLVLSLFGSGGGGAWITIS